MQILITNDDGYFSPGISAMAKALQVLGEVFVVAPQEEQSGVAQSITFRRPLTLRKFCRHDSLQGWAVAGSPVDCVKLGVLKLLPQRPNLVVSGLNNGMNAGANIRYSGTVGAAREGTYHGITSIACSLQHQNPDGGTENFRPAAEMTVALIRDLLAQEKTPGGLYNINIPNAALKAKEPSPPAIVPVDTTLYWDQLTRHQDPANRDYFWLSGWPTLDRPNDQTDLGMLAQGRVTITPLSLEPTDAVRTNELKSFTFPHFTD